MAAARDWILRQWHDFVGPEATGTDNITTLTLAAVRVGQQHPRVCALV